MGTASNIRELFDSITDESKRALPPIEQDLSDSPAYTRSDASCYRCSGRLWRNSHVLVCQSCATVVGAGDPERTDPVDEWQYFHDNRPTYRNSNVQRQVGGFGEAYDWVKREDIDHPVSEIDPEVFYDDASE